MSHLVGRLAKPTAAALGAIVIAALTSSCGSSTDGGGSATKTVTAAPSQPPTVRVTKTVKPKPKPKPKAAKPKAGSADGDTFTMPNELGKSLQGAQDDLQEVSGNPFYPSFSKDATGAGRSQIFDSDWQVCGQNAAVGATVDIDTNVTFSVVRVTEDCP